VPAGWTTVTVKAAPLTHHYLWTLDGVGIREVESPRGDVGKVVVNQPARAGLRGWTDDVAEPGPRIRECGMIGRGEHLRSYSAPAS
jgi:hypothetical protein